MNKYSMKELAARIGRTEQRTRDILKKNYNDLYVNHRIIEKNTGRVYFDEEVLKALLKHYDIIDPEQEPEKKETVEDRVGVGQIENEKEENPNIHAPASADEADNERNIGKLIDILEQQLEYEKKRYSDLETKVNNSEAERLYWVKQCEELRRKNDELNEQLKLMAPAPQNEEQENPDKEKKAEEPAPAKMTFREWFKQRFSK